MFTKIQIKKSLAVPMKQAKPTNEERNNSILAAKALVKKWKTVLAFEMTENWRGT